MNKSDKKKLSYFMEKWGLNFIINPDVEFNEIPIKYRNRMFCKYGKRRKDDPFWINKENGKIKLYF